MRVTRCTPGYRQDPGPPYQGGVSGTSRSHPAPLKVSDRLHPEPSVSVPTAVGGRARTEVGVPKERRGFTGGNDGERGGVSRRRGRPRTPDPRPRTPDPRPEVEKTTCDRGNPRVMWTWTRGRVRPRFEGRRRSGRGFPVLGRGHRGRHTV